MSTEADERGAAVILTYPDLAGKVAVVTGGSGGIGAATCRLLAANGARVAVHCREEAKIDAVVDEIVFDGGRAIGVTAEVADFADIERMRLRVEEDLGPVEVLAAFAASGGPLPGPTVEITEEGWRSAVDGNLTSAFLTLKSFLPGMIERGEGT
jgi:3-oxoacyl-[acyl-carrier protein] reductase